MNIKNSRLCEIVAMLLAPCHNLQSLTPIENIVAMYDEAWIYGK